jgi:hypothetical protein
MTRRYHFKKKRRVRSNSTGHPQDQNDAPSRDSSLEEDLRQQRIRQQERELQNKKQQEQEAKHRERLRQLQLEEQLREQELDEIWKEPATSKKMILKGLSIALANECSVSLPPSFALSHVRQSSCSWQGYERRRLLHLWNSKHLLENMGINSRTFLLYSKKYKWADRTLPDGTHSAWDLSCKHRLHPSARTFDVANVQEGKLPTIASIVEEGWSILNGYRDQVVHVQRSAPVHAIRLHESNGRVGVLRRDENGAASEQFLLYQLDGDIKRLLFSTDLLGISSNDFYFGKDLILFVGPRRYQGKKVRPLFLPLSPQGNACGVRELDIQNIPDSDTMRVEMTCKHDPIIGFGHRNGQVSILDLRDSTTVCSILQCEDSGSSPSAGAPLGSVSDLNFLSSLDTQKILVRRSNGTCQLHDLRASSTNESVNPALSCSSSLLWNMKVPLNEINPTLTARCNGIAVDPIGCQTLISPYIVNSNDARLGIWSLGTGLMVGSRLLKSCSSMDDAMYVELCQKVTPSFASCRDAGVSCMPSSFSVWAKCGAHSQREVGSKVGSLHQLSFLGSWK